MGILRRFYDVLKIQSNSGGWGRVNDKLRILYTLFRYILLKHCVLLRLINLKKYAYNLYPTKDFGDCYWSNVSIKNISYGNEVPFKEPFAFLWYSKF
jgi:hypothetical protein